MNSMNQCASRYFQLGQTGVRLDFPDSELADQACRHIFLSDCFPGQVIAKLLYINDEAVGRELSMPGRPNVVGISRKKREDGRERLLLQMFDAFTVALDFCDDTIQIRYPSHAPVRLLLDDVLQAAMQYVLDRIGGFILHGACMVRDGRAIVFMGNSGAGKSTSAFNLIRFGFHCYADDAVLVTPGEEGLLVWPLSREFSLRPLSFKLFEKQGIPLGDYQKEGQKFYFSQTAERLPGARLEHICFLELSGDAQTTYTTLGEAQTLSILCENKRHFSFMGRSDAEKYARTLARRTPMPITARVGTDLHYQGKMFDLLLAEGDSQSSIGIKPVSQAATRKEKRALIRQAWGMAGNYKLADLIPLLADYDPHVFKLVLSFFQTLPVARLQPVREPIAIPQGPMTNFAPWVDLPEWINGCEKLMAESAMEVLQRFVYPWFVSAPLLYPFLRALAAGEQDRLPIIQQAWQQFLERQYKGEGIRQNGNVGSAPKEEKTEVPRVDRMAVVWISANGKGDWRLVADEIENTHGSRQLTVIPVVNREKHLPQCEALIHHLSRRGVNIKIARQIPLCQLNNEDATSLLSSNRFDYHRFEDGKQSCAAVFSDVDRMKSDSYSSFEEAAKQVGFSRNPAAFEQCDACAMTSLGLCCGGFLLQ